LQGGFAREKLSGVAGCLFKRGFEESSALKKLALLAQFKGLKPKVVFEKQFHRLLNFKKEVHQGILVEVKHQFPEPRLGDLSKREQAVVLILDRIQDPKNLGAILRTAWLMSVSCVFLSAQNSVGLSPAVIKTASGAVEHLPVFVRNQLHSLIKELKKHSFWIYGLSPEGKKTLWEENLEGKKAFVLGGEHSGLRASLKKECDELLSIPQKDSSASYNVSVSAGIALYENSRQEGMT